MTQKDRSANTLSHRPWWLLPPGQWPAWWWIPVGIVIFAIEAAFRFDETTVALFIVPVTMAAWYSGRRTALILVTLLTVAHTTMALEFFPHPRLTADDQWRIGGITFILLAFLALVFARFGEYERRLTRQIRVLEGLLPICAVCKSIRDPEGQWTRLESFIQERSEAQFSHGVCPQCIEQEYARTNRAV